MMTPAGPRLLATALGTLAIASAGCGGGEDERRSTRFVTPGKTPLINSMDVNPADGAILLTTNKGFYRIEKGAERATPVRGVVREGRRGPTSSVGSFLELAFVGPNRLLGSGHPDRAGPLPEFLGLIRSDDGGRTWTTVSRLGLSDLHVIHALHGRVYAYDVVLGGVVVSRDGGTTWSERATPPGLVADLVVDPADPAYLLASNEDGLFRSTDEGKSWRALGAGASARLAWPAAATLYRANRDGAVQASADKGETWRDAGRVQGEPWSLKAVDERTLYVTLSDARIERSTDGGRTWKVRFRP